MIITIENRESGKFRTFRIETMPESASFAAGKQVLSLLVGPNNSQNYKGFAFIDGNDVHVWKKCKGQNGDKSDFEHFARLVEGLVIFQQPSSRYAVLEATECRRCGELMTVPQSIRRGIGPVCAGRE